MSKHRVTLKDIAEKLGITIATVSKALKDYPDISVNTKKAVQKLAKELHYQPNTQALALRGNKSNTIGLIIPEIVHYFFSNVIKGVMNIAEQNNYQVLITLSDNLLENEKRQANLLFVTKVDGVLVSLSNETDNTNHFDIFKDYDIPIVMFDKVNKYFECNKVAIDDLQGGLIATEHLINQGCRRIAHIRGPLKPLNSIGRYEGYKKALNRYNLDFDASLVKECNDVTLEEGYEFGKQLLQTKNPPDGIFTVTDQVGSGVIRAAHDLGIKIPQDVKVVGFSDSQIAQVSQPSLSTIHQPGYEIGEKAAKLLIEEIELQEKEDSPPIAYNQIIFDTYLIKRAST